MSVRWVSLSSKVGSGVLGKALIIVKGAEAPGVVVVELVTAWGLWAYMSFNIVHNWGRLLWPYRVPYNLVGMVAFSRLTTASSL